MTLFLWLTPVFRDHYIQLANDILPTLLSTSPIEIEVFIRLVPIFHTRYSETREMKWFVPRILAIQRTYPTVSCEQMCDAFRDHQSDVQTIQFTERVYLNEEEKMEMYRDRIRGIHESFRIAE
jgi:hypothetical protein